MGKCPDLDADWPFLRDGPVTLFRSPDVLDDAVTCLRAAGYRVHEIDCSSDAACAASFATALHWAAKFGYVPQRVNLDALNDAMWPDPAHDAERSVLVLRAFDSLRKRSKATAHGILDVIACNERTHLIHGRRLLCFVQTTHPGLKIKDLGGRSAQWNTKEWARRP